MIHRVNVNSSRRRRAIASRWAHRARVIEAMVLLTVASAAQRWMCMPKWSRVLGTATAVPAGWRGERIELLPLRWATPSERKVVKAVHSASRMVPWAPKCLAEAAAGQLMLRQLGSPGVVVIGIRPGEDTSTAAWDAHAWLLGHHGALTGGRAVRGFTATTVFEVSGGLSASEVHLGAAPGGPGGT